MKKTSLVITSIAKDTHPILRLISKEAKSRELSFILIGDTKSPKRFNLKGCDFFSVKKQLIQNFYLAKKLPFRHYARKNIGYLIAMSQGSEIIIETDDDNIPLRGFWSNRSKNANAHILKNKGWVNVYEYFSEKNIWPRGFPLEYLKKRIPALGEKKDSDCPIQQGLADDNPDVDAIYRLLCDLPIKFKKVENIVLSNGSFCPFNSQNTTWFKDSFPLMYLPSYCSFRMTDIWRSFVAQRIAWTCDWSILFHKSTVRQKRNDHNLLKDFKDEVSGYLNNSQIFESLKKLKLKRGVCNINENMILCYEKLIELNLVDKKEMVLLKAWLRDVKRIM